MATYCRQRFEWNETQASRVDWESFRSARRSLPQLRTFVTKLCAKALPTNKKLSQRDNSPAQCLLCGAEESNSHLWLCRCRQSWRTTFCANLAKHLHDVQTTPQLTTDILSKTRQYLEDPVQDKHSDWQYAWTFRGFIPQEWSVDQSQDWGKRLIQFIWNELHALWKQRNDTIHDKDQRNWSSQDGIRAEAAIKAFYRYKSEIGAHDRQIFTIPWQERLQSMTPKEVLSWIRHMTPAILRAKRDYLTRSAHRTHDIRSFLTSPSPLPAA